MKRPQDKDGGDAGTIKDAPSGPAGTPGQKTAEKTAETNTETTAKKPGTRPAKETGGRGGLDPTRYGDWEKNGRAIDF